MAVAAEEAAEVVVVGEEAREDLLVASLAKSLSADLG